MLVASRRSRARQQADRSLSLLVGWVVSWRSEDLRDARVATWQATLPDWQPACARVWVGLLGFQAPEGHPGGFVSAWARPGSHGGRRQTPRCRRRVRRLRPESGKPPPALPHLLEQHAEEGTEPLRRMSSAVQHHAQSSSVLTGSGALVARLQCKSVRHVQATHRRQARRISAARPLIRSDWNQARPPRGLRLASPSFVPRPRTGCTPLHLVRAADGAALASSLMPDPGGVGNGQASPAPATKNRPRHTSSPDLHINDAAPAVAFSGETLRRVRCG